ncbi:MAG: hypothetical protein A9183_00515 [Dehalococcoides mccartyi]|uniref:NAD(P)/FAD-dependent oxidoreductase n=1 Tax=Dehalococcoides mccartyi TaxID=61435 RepID=UPI000804C809|nr:NAD(P)/FAD-dependent oxidoreductase [Dehalococcoides mccartyi]OBW62895.1 MAG: hypothetical protein A9183_00515 [Dehalococcoides mccartyi]
MPRKTTLIIGGGAAGMVASISKARRGEPVMILEKTAQLGKKILASGNGRCNLLNEALDSSSYNPEARPLVNSVFSRFGRDDILNFFSELGLHYYSQDGRIFPFTNQAASVQKVLELEIKRLGVQVEYGFDCVSIQKTQTGFSLGAADGKQQTGHSLILTGGGSTYPSFGSDGSGYKLASSLGHRIIKPVPSTVPLVVKDPLCHLLQGQRIIARAQSRIQGKIGNPVDGELLFTKYGLSGSLILDISQEISLAINRLNIKDVSLETDLIPFMEQKQLETELTNRHKMGLTPEDMLTGILPGKLCLAFKQLFEKENPSKAAVKLKNWRFEVSGTRGWNEAEFTAGGIDTKEVDPQTLESKLVKGLYLAGEVLDVNGKRGGYNLGFAWASGYVAGLS